jgi:hypothetical protein
MVVHLFLHWQCPSDGDFSLPRYIDLLTTTHYVAFFKKFVDSSVNGRPIGSVHQIKDSLSHALLVYSKSKLLVYQASFSSKKLLDFIRFRSLLS